MPPHKPSRKQAVIFFIFTLFLVAGIFLWVFYLNKGEITVSGKPPFTISVADKEILCEEALCKIKLVPRSYRILLKKDNFYTDIQDIELRRGETQKITMNLRFIPVVKEVGPLVLPHPDAPLLPFFRGETALSNFPKNVKRAVFSHKDKAMVLTIGRETYLYDFPNTQVLKLSIRIDSPIALVDKHIVFLENENEGQVLKMIIDEMRVETVLRFDRPFSNPILFGAPKGNKLLIQEENEGVKSFYLIDIEKKTRRKFDTKETLQNPHFTTYYLVFETGGVGDKKIVVFDPTTLDEFELPTIALELPALDAKNVSEPRAGVFLFLSDERMDTSEEVSGPAISDILKEATRETFQAEQFLATIFITEFDMQKKSYRTIASISRNEKTSIQKLTSDLENGKIYFEQGEKLFEIILKE